MILSQEPMSLAYRFPRWAIVGVCNIFPSPRSLVKTNSLSGLQLLCLEVLDPWTSWFGLVIPQKCPLNWKSSNPFRKKGYYVAGTGGKSVHRNCLYPPRRTGYNSYILENIFPNKLPPHPWFQLFFPLHSGSFGWIFFLVDEVSGAIALGTIGSSQFIVRK